MSGIRTHTLVVIGIDCINSCKSNYHTTTTTTARPHFGIFLSREEIRKKYKKGEGSLLKCLFVDS
jgi:hypothetical protein